MEPRRRWAAPRRAATPDGDADRGCSPGRSSATTAGRSGRRRRARRPPRHRTSRSRRQPIALARSPGSVNRPMIRASATAETPRRRRGPGPRGRRRGRSRSARGRTRAEAMVNATTPPRKTRLLPQQVAQPAGEQQEAAEGQQVGVDHPGQRGLREAEVGLDRRQRHVHDALVQDDHQVAQAQHVEREPPALRRGCVRNGIAGRPGRGLGGRHLVLLDIRAGCHVLHERLWTHTTDPAGPPNSSVERNLWLESPHVTRCPLSGWSVGRRAPGCARRASSARPARGRSLPPPGRSAPVRSDR